MSWAIYATMAKSTIYSVVTLVAHLPSKMVISNTSPTSLQPTQCCIWMSCRLNLQLFEISIFWLQNCCLLTCHQLTWKHLQTVAIEQNEELQGLWEADIVQYTDTDVFVALDESEVDDSIYTSSCKTHYAKKWTSPSICKVAVCGIGHGTSPELDSQWMHDMDQD